MTNIASINQTIMTNNTEFATIVDVRTPEEFKTGHINGAINIPLDKLQERLDEFRQMPKPILAYCRSGARSGMAVGILKQNGIDQAVNGGGLEEAKRKVKA